MSEKLVRDLIPAIIDASNRKAIVRRCSAQEREQLLLLKLQEEVAELVDARSVEELADVLEVVHALARQLGASIEAVESERIRKRRERGGFERGIVLIEITSC